jgi:beta-phosphoglucomutase-like phosphatase (HAD superfamily)
MTSGQSPHAKLDAIIRQARYLLISFDGPIHSADTGYPAPYIHDLLAACRESGRSVAAISTTPAAEVRAYLDAHDLSTQIAAVVSSIDQAVTALDASPADCVLITISPRDIAAAEAADVPTIVYAVTRDNADHQTAAGATAIISSMSDLALCFRARPMKNLHDAAQYA